jgi:oxygen-independent coproporphyrinogen-3 oxidase
MSSASAGPGEPGGIAVPGGAPADLHVYLHAPYCRIQCPYCTFYTLLRPSGGAPMLRFLRALEREWDLRVRPWLDAGARLRTVYLGGGTPSDLPHDALVRFLDRLQAGIPGGFAALDEVTIECNPESTTPALLDALQHAGANRISLGVQAVHDADLARLGRGAGAAEVERGLACVSERFANWNADLILGIPGSNEARLVAGLSRLQALGAPHLSFYCLEMPPAQAALLGDAQDAASDAFKASLYEQASAWVTAHGYEHYEISNACRPGHRARHNTAYWEGKAYIGLGPGAHSFGGGARSANRADIAAYLAALESGREPPRSTEVLTPEQRLAERTLLGLRRQEGLEVEPDALQAQAAWLGELASAGLARLEGGRLQLTPKGWLVSDSIIVQWVTRQTRAQPAG